MDAEQPNNDQTRTIVLLQAGTIIGHYRIIDKVGAGGMGEVYLAMDTKLDRRVALKFLPIHLTQSSDNLARFVREAQAAAKINHPNVVVVYETGEFQGRPFFAMELVEGLSLRDLIRRQRLGMRETVELVIGICDGLKATHDKQIIHRDIKPSNIVIDSSGRAKILDFGLSAIRDTEQLTRGGSIMGTIQYMSPEQAEGKAVDCRSDLFSLGVVFYELLSGRCPFERDSEMATLRAILSESPEPLTRYRADVPDELQRTISKLLDRNPSHRYQSASDLSADLRRLLAAASTPVTDMKHREESIVVLPFENVGSDPDTEYFSDGLTEEIITDLGKIGGFRVVSRKSSMLLKGTDKDIRSLGREFDVMYVLTGSVRRIGDNIRVNCELVMSSDERQLWGERYTGTTQDVFAIQEKISRSIADALKVKLSVSESIALTNRGISNPRAYDLFLRSRQETEKWTREGLDLARDFLSEALRLEPNSATLHAALGYNYYNYVNMGFHQDESITKAMQCVQMAFELEPESIDALRLQGIIQIALTGEARQGLQSLEKVLTMAPNDTEALAWASATAGMRGKPDAGIAYGEQLVKLESLVPLNYSFFAWSHFLKGDFARSLELSESVISKDSKNKLVKFTRAISLIYLGKKEEAAELIPSFESDQHLSIFDRMILVQIYGALGRREKVEATLTDECKASARRDLQYPWHIAVAWTMLGEYDEAIAWLTIAIDNGFAHYQFLETLDPFLEPLRGDSRFVALINRARAEALSCTQ